MPLGLAGAFHRALLVVCDHLRNNADGSPPSKWVDHMARRRQGSGHAALPVPIRNGHAAARGRGRHPPQGYTRLRRRIEPDPHKLLPEARPSDPDLGAVRQAQRPETNSASALSERRCD